MTTAQVEGHKMLRTACFFAAEDLRQNEPNSSLSTVTMLWDRRRGQMGFDSRKRQKTFSLLLCPDRLWSQYFFVSCGYREISMTSQPVTSICYKRFITHGVMRLFPYALLVVKKLSLYRPEQAPGGSGRSRHRIFMTFGTMKVVGR